MHTNTPETHFWGSEANFCFISSQGEQNNTEMKPSQRSATCQPILHIIHTNKQQTLPLKMPTHSHVLLYVQHAHTNRKKTNRTQNHTDPSPNIRHERPLDDGAGAGRVRKTPSLTENLRLPDKLQTCDADTCIQRPVCRIRPAQDPNLRVNVW